MADRTVLVTRPVSEGERTAEHLRALGWTPILAPLLTIRPLPARLPLCAAAILLTSGNAIASIPPWAATVPILAVGDSTATRTQMAGFTNVISANGDADALAALVERTFPPGSPLLLLCGKAQGTALAEHLNASGWPVSRHEVYEAVPATALPQPARAAIKDEALTAALFYSAATAHCFASLADVQELQHHLKNTDACAIGAAAAMALEQLPWRSIRVAARPTQEAMLALLP